MASFTGVALVCLVVLCALGQAWGSVDAVDGVFSKSDRKDLAQIVSGQQQKDGSFGSLEDTYEAVSALLALRSEVKHKDDVCKYAAAQLTAAKTSESVFYAATIAELLNCGSSISKATATILNEAVAAADLHANYFAIAAAYYLNLGKHLGSDFNRAALKDAVKRFADLAGAEGRFARTAGGKDSSYNSALAFQATAFAAALTDIEKEAINEIADEVTNLIEAEALSDRNEDLAFEDESGVESALETTAEVVEGIDALARLVGKPLGLKPEHVVGLTQFFVNLDDDVSNQMKATNFSYFLVVLLVSSFFVALIKAEDNTAEYYVDGTDGSDTEGDGTSGSPFASLNGALTAFTAASAASTDEPLYNLIINVKKGTYSGNDNLNLPFFVNTTIQNSDDEDNTVFFECDENNAWAFNPIYGSFQLYWVTIQNCQRGVNVEYKTTLDYQDVYIDHVIFQNISLNAVWIEFASSIAVKDSMFQSPSGDAYKAFINVIGNYTAGIDIINNQFQDGSGIQISYMNGGNINQNTFTSMYGNAEDAPPALFITGGVWDINENTFSNVTSLQYSTATFHASAPEGEVAFGNFSLNGNSFDACNTTEYYGGALSFVGVLGEVEDCSFTANLARLGGAVFLSAANVTIQKSSFSNNYATNNGGAIDIEFGSVLFLYDNQFEGNTAGENSTSNSLSCCVAEGASQQCTSQLLVNNGDQGDFADQQACTAIQYVSTNEYFQSLASYQYQPFTTPGGSSLWWLWMLISFALIVTIIVVGLAVGAFIYTKKQRSYEAYA